MDSIGTYSNVIRALRVAIFAAFITVLALCSAAFAPDAHAASGDKPDSVMLKVGTETKEVDVTKNVATLDQNSPNTELAFTIKDAYELLSSNVKLREFILVDSSGKQVETIYSDNGNGGHFTIGKLKANHKLVLVTSTRDAGSSTYVKRYEQQLNVRLADTKKAEADTKQIPGVSEDGGTWSFSNGLQYTFKNTGFKFLDNTTMNLGALKLPLTYKHNSDGTTIVGINADPDNKAFYDAVKNGNVWQKYTTDKMAEMTKQMDRGWSGRNFGSWGGKAFDWNVCGYMEFNTKDPAAPHAVNLIISMGMKAEGHAQYLCFTGTITFTIGGKATLTGKLIPVKGVEGKFNLGAYAGLELYIGIGLNYVASVGGYGKGQINIDFQMLPETQLEQIKLSGELGAKAKLFGFTIYTWKILNGEKPLYQRQAAKKQPSLAEVALDKNAKSSEDAVLPPLGVSSDAEYPLDARDYLDESENGSESAAGTEIGNEGALSAQGQTPAQVGESAPSTEEPAAPQPVTEGEQGASAVTLQAQSETLIAQEAESSGKILQGIYGETELSCVSTNSGPVVAYIADANEVGGSRDSANRSILVYSRKKADGWTAARIVDMGSAHKDYADYTPSISTDGENVYVSWLAANSNIDVTIDENDGNMSGKIGQMGDKLDVKVATITKDDLITVETVCNESGTAGTIPANPKAAKVGSDLYVGWYTNQASGSSGEVIGVNGTHTVRLYKKLSDGTWTESSNAVTENGAITSFDLGIYGGSAACAWSLDKKFSSLVPESSLNGVKTLDNSDVYTLGPDGASPNLVAMKATNAQFAKNDGADILTYAIRTQSGIDETATYLSIQSSQAPGDSGELVLDGSKVNLPTPYYMLTGDLGLGRSGNVSFLVLDNGSSDIQALVTTGAGNDDWTSVVEATEVEDAVTDFCATYANGLPLFIYTTESVSAVSGLGAQAEAGANLNQTTSSSLKHLSVVDADFDEYGYKAGEKMPMTVYFSNDGMLDVSGVDLWLLEDGVAKKVATSDATVALDEEGSITFDYTIPALDTFTKAHEFTLFAASAGTEVTTKMIEHAKQTESALSYTIGAPSLALSTEQQVIDGQESIVSTVVNDGMVPHAAKLLYVNADTGDVLMSVDVPELDEGEEFSHTYSAPNGYFRNDGIESIIITLEDDGSENEGYDINNTEYVSTWEVIDEAKTPTSSSSSSKSSTARPMPKTGDLVMLTVVLIALAAVVATSIVLARSARKKRM